MPVSPTYPGIYIEEIQSSAHTITAAPTNLAVFVGYSHPFKTPPVGPPAFNTAVECFSFTDYEANFGGYFGGQLFSPDPGDPDNFFGSLPLAVNQFFLNGGTQCYVVGLQAKPAGQQLTAGSVTTLSGITFTALEPTDSTLQMFISITPKPATPSTPISPPSALSAPVADITITYGSGAAAVVEVYRKVNYADVAKTGPGAPINGVSKLVKVLAPLSGVFIAESEMLTSMSPLAPPLSITNDFVSVFQQDTSLYNVPIFNLMVLPGVISNIILSEALALCELRRAFLIIDGPEDAGSNPTASPPISYIGDYVNGNDPPPLEPNAAIYFPYLKSNDPVSGIPIEIPPAATVAGIYAQTDLARGVWKAPAGLATVILGATGPVTRGLMSDMRQGVLNQIAVNCLRAFPSVGTVVFGARTSAGADANTAQQQWKYVPVRRMALFLEQTLYNNLGWVVFEPNDTPLWTAIVASIEAFMLGLFRQGAFQGSTPSDAFKVKCDNQTTTQADIDNGIVNIVVAFAPLKPAEFVVIQIAQIAGQTQTS
jgi:phage tail sheath protein FI